MGRHSRNAFEPAPVAEAPRPRGHRSNARRRKSNPVRTGLLASSAALAVGAIGVSSGLLPSPDGSGGISYHDNGPGQIQAAGIPNSSSPQDLGTVPADRPSQPASRGDARATPPRSTPPSAPATSASPTPTPTPSRTAGPPTTAPTAPQTSAPATVVPTTPPVATALPVENGSESAAEAAVLALVNQQRATAGCQPVTDDEQLDALASDFSADMAARAFFDHTDPDGDDPWDRAAQAGVKDLGGENIARGQATAEEVMTAWMNSDGHRANILNCDFKTLGVGAVFGDGGPWWTQDFGY